MAEQLALGPTRPLPAAVMGAPVPPAEAEAAAEEETDTTAPPQPAPVGQAQPIAAEAAEEGQPSAAEELGEPGAEAAEAAAGEDAPLTNLPRYRCRAIPAAGALLREEDGEQMRLL